MRVDFSREFLKQLKKSPEKVRLAYLERFQIFSSDEFHPLLNNHALAGEFQNYRSFNVTGDWRVVYKEITKGFILFIAIGKHSQLYR